MGTQIVAKNVNAESFALKYAAPVRRGLEAWHFLNTDLVKAARNYAPGKPNAKVIGEPTVQANFMQFKSLSNFLQTDVKESAAMTIFAVVRCVDTMVDDAHKPMFLGTFRSMAADGSGETFGVSLYANGVTSLVGGASRGTSVADDTSSGAGLSGHDFTKFALIVQEVYAGPMQNRITNATAGVSATGSSSAPRYPSAGVMRIGSGYHQFSGAGEIAFAALYSVSLDADEIAAVVADIRRYMATRGVVV